MNAMNFVLINVLIVDHPLEIKGKQDIIKNLFQFGESD